MKPSADIIFAESLQTHTLLEADVIATALETTLLSTTSTTPDMYHINSTQGVNFAIVLNSVCLLSALFGLGFLLPRRNLIRFLAPRLATTAGLDAGSKIPRCLGWATEAWRRRAELDHADIDGAAFVRFCVLGFKFSAAGSLCSLILVPCYAGGHADPQAPGFNRYSVANLSSDGSRFWVVVVAAYFMTGVFCHLAEKEWRYFIELRHSYFRQATHGEKGAGAAQASRSLIVESVPATHRSDEQVRDFFTGLFGPGSVHSGIMQPDTADAHRLYMLQTASQRFCCCCRRAMPAIGEGLLDPLAGARCALDDLTSAGPTVVAASAPNTSLIQPLSLASDLHVRTLQAVRLVQGVTFGTGQVSTAFVTLRKVSHALAAEQMVLSRFAGWRVRAAPESKDILWRNAAVTLEAASSRELLGQVAVVLGLLGWIVPVTIVQAVASADSLTRWFPFIKDVQEDFPRIYAVAVGYLPVVALMGLLQMLPIAFHWLAATFERRKIREDIEQTVLQRCLWFQLATLYVTVLASSLWDTLQVIVSHGMQAALEELARQVPQVSVYFITFVIARAGASMPLLLLRPTKIFSSGPSHCIFAQEAGDVALVLTLGLTYCAIAPAIMPACAVYFGVAILVYRWLFMYVYTPDVDCGGRLWHTLFRSSMVGLMLGNLLVATITGSQTGPLSIECLLLLLLPLLVLLFYKHCHDNFMVPSLRMPLDDAVASDDNCQEGREQYMSSVGQLRLDYYRDPITLTEDEARQ